MSDDRMIPALYPYDGEADEGLAIFGSPNMFTMMMVTYVKGVGMSLRSIIVPGSRLDLYMEDMDGSGLCDCHPGLGWELVAIDPESHRVVRTLTLDTHVAMVWMQAPQGVLEINLDDMDTTEEIVFIPEGEQLASVVNDYNGSIDGSLTMSDLDLSDEELGKFFENGESE